MSEEQKILTFQGGSTEQKPPSNDVERRGSARTPIRRLAYVNLEPYDNGGVVTDISQTGLRFHMVKPVEHGGVVRLSLVFGSAHHVQIVGQLVWLDPTRKIGGVHFTVVPPGAADDIIAWAQESNSSDGFKSARSHPNDAIPNATTPVLRRPDSSPPVTPVSSHESSQSEPGDFATGASPRSSEPSTHRSGIPDSARLPHAWMPASARQQSKDTVPQQQAASPRLNSVAPSPQPLPIPPQGTPMPWITHFDPDPPSHTSLFLRGVLGGIALCALFGVAGWYAVTHDGFRIPSLPFGNSSASPSITPNPAPPDSVPQPPSATSTALASPPAIPSQESESTSAQASPVPSVTNNVPAGDNQPLKSAASTSIEENKPTTVPQVGASSVPEPVKSSAPQPIPASEGQSSTAAYPQNSVRPLATPDPAPADPGESQLLLAREYLDGRARPRNPSIASQLLWSAVEKGNAAAEMDLASLYLHGDGVAKNCDQARVLLTVAAEKGITEAAQQLRQLNLNGCR